MYIFIYFLFYVCLVQCSTSILIKHLHVISWKSLVFLFVGSFFNSVKIIIITILVIQEGNLDVTEICRCLRKKTTKQKCTQGNYCNYVYHLEIVQFTAKNLNREIFYIESALLNFSH